MPQAMGTATSTVMQSPTRKKHRAKRRRAEEAAWRRRCGPVRVRYLPPAVR